MQIQQTHLTYCSNIHPGESWEAHFTQLQAHFPKIKKALSPQLPMGIGLRLANQASLALSEKEALAAFKRWLDQHEAYVFTLNGFPYGSFHHTEVKDLVHAPDWTSTERRDYTIRLANILAQLLPSGLDGGISTSPLSYRHWFVREDLQQAKNKSTSHIVEVALHLIAIQQQTGHVIHLDIEPEPDGILESGEEFINWYENLLIPQAIPAIRQKFAADETDALQLLKTHICLCYDVCHFALGYESHETVINCLEQKGIRIGKFQISAALKADLQKGQKRKQTLDAFAAYNEPTYLHQVVASTRHGALVRYPDLPQALQDANNPKVNEWRAHFHVPVFKEQLGLLQSTQQDVLQIIQIQKQQLQTRHMEVETYTWDVLPEEFKLPIDQSIIRELQWVKEQMQIS